MPTEHRTCQNCQQEFVIAPEDFAFYEKMQVPPPTWCPMCRAQRRLSWYAERTIHFRTCAGTGKKIFSMVHPDEPFTIVENDYWWSDAWDGVSYGRDIDWSTPLMQQFYNIAKAVPLPARSILNIENSDYTNNVGNMKNCHLVFSGDSNEDLLYCTSINFSRNCVDCNHTDHSELCYGSMKCLHCYRCFYCVDCEQSNNLYFCKNVNNCSDCIGCVNVRNKKYCILNVQYSKEEYEKKLHVLKLNTYTGVQEFTKQWRQFLQQFPVPYIHSKQAENCSGDYIYNSSKAIHCYGVTGVENSKYVQLSNVPATKDCYDYSVWGFDVELLYECLTIGSQVSNTKFSLHVYPNCTEVEYSLYCASSSNLFLCAGLKKKQYCILNKQYTKEQYEELVPKLKKHMSTLPYRDKLGREYGYGEFMPSEFAPFGYNETIAYEFFPLTQEQAKTQGFSWRHPLARNYSITLQPTELPDDIMDVHDDILQQTIGCEHAGTCGHNCSTAFKIIPQELAFYRAQGVPLPHVCVNCRHYNRLRWRNGIKQYQRSCMCAGSAAEGGGYHNQTAHDHAGDHCPRHFETSYSPDTATLVYCKECYQSETT